MGLLVEEQYDGLVVVVPIQTASKKGGEERERESNREWGYLSRNSMTGL